MTEPMTNEVFTSYALKAIELGREHGLRDRAAYIEDWGHEPEWARVDDCDHDLPNPLSGEWAGDLTPNGLMYELGLDGVDLDDMDELCVEFEDAHNAAFLGQN